MPVAAAVALQLPPHDLLLLEVLQRLLVEELLVLLLHLAVAPGRALLSPRRGVLHALRAVVRVVVVLVLGVLVEAVLVELLLDVLVLDLLVPAAESRLRLRANLVLLLAQLLEPELLELLLVVLLPLLHVAELFLVHQLEDLRLVLLQLVEVPLRVDQVTVHHVLPVVVFIDHAAQILREGVIAGFHDLLVAQPRRDVRVVLVEEPVLLERNQRILKLLLVRDLRVITDGAPLLPVKLHLRVDRQHPELVVDQENGVVVEEELVVVGGLVEVGVALPVERVGPVERGDGEVAAVLGPGAVDQLERQIGVLQVVGLLVEDVEHHALHVVPDHDLALVVGGKKDLLVHRVPKGKEKPLRVDDEDVGLHLDGGGLGVEHAQDAFLVHVVDLKLREVLHALAADARARREAADEVVVVAAPGERPAGAVAGLVHVVVQRRGAFHAGLVVDRARVQLPQLRCAVEGRADQARAVLAPFHEVAALGVFLKFIA